MKRIGKMRKARGFTLIELMIVVAIIGILAAVAIPKFADLIRKSQEGSTKGSLGAFRSALTIYYGEMEGIYPTYPTASVDISDGAGEAFAGPPPAGTAGGPFITKYLESRPTVRLGLGNTHPEGTAVFSAESADRTSASTAEDTGAGGTATAEWRYASAVGALYVGCTHTDTKSSTIGAW